MYFYVYHYLSLLFYTFLVLKAVIIYTLGMTAVHRRPEQEHTAILQIDSSQTKILRANMSKSF